MPDDAPDPNEELLAEIRALRGEVARLQAYEPGAHKLRPARTGGRFKVAVHALETDPDVQYKVHRWGVLYWVLNIPVVCWLFFAHPDVWVKWGVFITLIYSLYANLATDYGAMSSAMAAKGAQRPPEIPLEPVVSPPPEAPEPP